MLPLSFFVFLLFCFCMTGTEEKYFFLAKEKYFFTTIPTASMVFLSEVF